MGELVTNEQWARKKIERDVVAYLDGGGDLELQHLAILGGYCGVPLAEIRMIWEGAREIRARRSIA